MSVPFLILFFQEYILKGVVNASLGQEIGSVSIGDKVWKLHLWWSVKVPFILILHNSPFQREHLKIAQQFFQLVGGSASECGIVTSRLMDVNFSQEHHVSMCECMFLSFQTLFLADSAWPPASSSWGSLKMCLYISTQSRLVPYIHGFIYYRCIIYLLLWHSPPHIKCFLISQGVSGVYVVVGFFFCRVTSTMTTPSTSTTLRLKQHLATTKKLRRYFT